MPWNSGPAGPRASGRRGRRPARLAPRLAVAAVLVLLCGAIYVVLRTSHQHPRVTACMAADGRQDWLLTPGQAGIASVIAGVATRRALPARAVAIAYATALQESKLSNLHYGDLDSVGVFQQRPSQGWGTVRQIEDPVYATGRFFDALVAVPDYLRLPIDVAAQDVQHSADGAAYGQYAAMGTALAVAFTGADPHGVWCSYGDPPARTSLDAAGGAMASAFGLTARPQDGGRAMTVRVGQQAQGWAVAAWLVTHAGSYGIASVRYDGYQWHGFSGRGRWTSEPGRASAPGGTAAVLFG